MLPTYHRLLKQISAEAMKAGCHMQPPCNSKALADLQLKARQRLGFDLPPEHAAFLRQHNGLDWDGLTIYASETVPIVGYTDRFIQGFVEVNHIFHDNPRMKPFLVFGDTGMDFYVYEPATGRYGARDRVSLDLNESYASFEDMLAAALRTRL